MITIFCDLLPIFGEKIGVCIKNQCYDQHFAYFSFVLSQNANFFAEFFGENIFKNHNTGPRLGEISPFGKKLTLIMIPFCRAFNFYLKMRIFGIFGLIFKNTCWGDTDYS
jgi:hypothetical protein